MEKLYGNSYDCNLCFDYQNKLLYKILKNKTTIILINYIIIPSVFPFNFPGNCEPEKFDIHNNQSKGIAQG